jgi:hypothetical protein
MNKLTVYKRAHESNDMNCSHKEDSRTSANGEKRGGAPSLQVRFNSKREVTIPSFAKVMLVLGARNPTIC